MLVLQHSFVATYPDRKERHGIPWTGIENATPEVKALARPAIDREQRFAYVVANRAHPGNYEIYRVPLTGGDLQQVTDLDGTGRAGMVDMITSVSEVAKELGINITVHDHSNPSVQCRVATVNQMLHNGQLPLLGSFVQRCKPVGFASIDVGPSSHDRSHKLQRRQFPGAAWRRIGFDRRTRRAATWC